MIKTMSLFSKDCLEYQVRLLFLPNRRSSIAVATVSIRSRELKINGVTICKFPLMRATKFDFFDNSIPLAYCARRIV